MTHATPPPGSRPGIVAELARVYTWNHAAELIQAWLEYERDLTRYAIDSKLKAERERAIEEAAQCCDVLAEKTNNPIAALTAERCADAIRALKVVP